MIATEPAVLVEARDLHKRFRDFHAVNGISFRCYAGEVFGLLGPNGAGKTTTIRMLTTILRPTAGVARVAGHDVVGDPGGVRRAIGVLPENSGVYGRLTAREAVRYAGQLYGVAHSAVVSHAAVLSNVCAIPTPRLLDMLTQWLLHPGTGQDVLIHPVAFAGWVGLLVTALNLLPGGMLDGGHVMRALFGPRAHTIISLAAAGVAFYFNYWLMGLLILLLVRRGHPGPLDDVSPLTTARVAMAGALLVIFVLSAVPLTLSCR